MIPSFANDVIYRLRAREDEERGSKIFDWDMPDRIDIKRCSVQPAETGLSQDGRVLGVNDGITVYAPLGSDIQEGDRVEIDGEVYTLMGLPRKWKSARGSIKVMILNLSRWQG